MPDQGLVDAFLLPPEGALRAWRAWRERADVNALSWADLQVLGLLAERLGAWLEGDCAAGVLLGIPKRTWTLNQVRLRLAAQECEALESRGIAGPAVCGAAGWTLQTRMPGCVRGIPIVHLLVRREEAPRAHGILVARGWELCGPAPEHVDLDYATHASFRKGGHYLELHWRIGKAPAWRARDFEAALQSTLRTVDWNASLIRVPSPAMSLLEMLTDRRADDPIPLEADIALFGMAAVDWAAFSEQARFCSPDAIEILTGACRRAGLAAPPVRSQPHSFARGRAETLWNEYKRTTWERRESATLPGFLHYLAAQWGVGSVWQLPLAGARRALKYRREILS